MADAGRVDEVRAVRLREAVVRFLAAADGQEAIAAIGEFPELLSNAGVRSVELSVEKLRPTFEAEQAEHLDSQVELLRRAQLVGIERALFDRMVKDFVATMDAANAILVRYLASGEAMLLDNAVDHWRPIVAHEYLTFLGAPTERWALRRAATALVHLFRRDREPEALDDAVSLLDRAVGLAVRNDRDLPGLCCEHGDALSLRYRLRGDPVDRTRAAEAYRAAVDASRPGSPARRLAAEGMRLLDLRDADDGAPT